LASIACASLRHLPMKNPSREGVAADAGGDAEGHGANGGAGAVSGNAQGHPKSGQARSGGARGIMRM